MKTNLRAGIPLLLGLLTGSILLYIYMAQHLPTVRSLLERNLTDKVQAIAGLSKPPVAKALETGDDISLLIQVENLARTDDVSAAYVLDEKGTVLIHNKNAEWHKTYTDAASQKAVSSSTELVQRIAGGYLYSIPVSTSATLCVQLSSQRSDALYAYTVRRSLLTGGVLFLLFMVFIVFLISAAVIAPLRRIGGFVRNFMPDGGARPSPEISEEMTALVAAVNEMAGRCEREHRAIGEHAANELNRAEALLAVVIDDRKEPCIVTDADNMVLALNDAAKRFWGTNATIGKHILDVKEYAGLVVLVQSVSACENKGRVISRFLHNRTIAAVSVVDSDGKIAGKIIRVVD
jgi:PAS domain-containing protein